MLLERRQDVVVTTLSQRIIMGRWAGSLRLMGGLVLVLFVGQVQVHVADAFSHVSPTPRRRFRGWGIIMDTSYSVISTAADVTNTRPRKKTSSSNHPLYMSQSSMGDGMESKNEDEEVKYQRLMDWLFQEEECEGEGSVEVNCCPLTGTRGLYARKDFQEGDCLFAIPLDAALVVEDVETSDAERGSKLLILLQQQDDRWRNYFNVLPTMNEMQFHPTPDFWTKDEIVALELPRLVNAALERKERIQSLAAKDEQMNVEELQFATWLVESRSLTLVGEPYPDCPEDELQTTSVLIPLLDMINHSSSNPNVELDVLQSDPDDDDDDDNDNEEEGPSFYAVIATEKIPKGTELFISYGTGEESSVELLQYYGFVPSSNPHDLDMLKYGNDDNDDDDDDDDDDYEDDNDDDADDDDDDDDGLLDEDEWTTSLEDDEKALDAGVVGVEKTILQFRIRMKQALREWDNEE